MTPNVKAPINPRFNRVIWCGNSSRPSGIRSVINGYIFPSFLPLLGEATNQQHQALQHGLFNYSGSLQGDWGLHGEKKKKTWEGVDGCEKLVINIVVTALIKLFSNFSTQKRTQFICLKSIAHFTVSHVPARRQCHYLFCSLSFHCTCSPKVESVIFSPLFKESESEKEKEGGRVNNNSSFINGWIWLSGDSFSNAVSQLSQWLLSNVYRATHAQIRSLKALITSEPSPLIFKIFFTLTSGKPI